MGNSTRFWELTSEHPFKAGPIAQNEEISRNTSQSAAQTKGYGATLDLVSQAAEVIKEIEDRAGDAVKHACGIADDAVQKLELAETRIEELKTELEAAQQCIRDIRVKMKESDESSRVERSRLEVAEKK